jgi:hypothetical protein
MSLTRGMAKVSEMVRKFEESKCISIDKCKLGVHINIVTTECQVPFSDIGRYRSSYSLFG